MLSISVAIFCSQHKISNSFYREKYLNFKTNIPPFSFHPRIKWLFTSFVSFLGNITERHDLPSLNTCATEEC